MQDIVVNQDVVAEECQLGDEGGVSEEMGDWRYDEGVLCTSCS